VSIERPLRLQVDFCYGGIDPGNRRGDVILYPKAGDRRGMMSSIQRQFETAGVAPEDGMAVVLVDPRADADDEGRVCDMVVPGVLRWDASADQWYATYDHTSMTWIPSDGLQA
jgi:hypothetical protein